MNILVLSNNASGTYHFRKEVLMEINKYDTVYISVPYDDFANNIEKIGIKCTFHDFDRRSKNPVNEFKLLFFYISLIKKTKADVVLTYTIKPNVYGGIACRLLRIPYVANVTGLGTSIQNNGLLSRISLILYKIGLNKAYKVFFQNEINAKFMLKNGIVNTRYDVLPGSGVNLKDNCFEDYPNNKKKISFITVGRIMKDKGINELLEAIKIIKRNYKNVEFKLVGGFDENYQETINKANDCGLIKYLGVSDNVHKLLKQSEAIIHPSYHEGMSNVLLEACAAGRPVIASNIPGCKEIFEDGITGIGFEPRSVDSLVKAIEKFLSFEYEKRKKMGVLARKKVEKEFDRNIVVNKYMECLKEIKEQYGHLE